MNDALKTKRLAIVILLAISFILIVFIFVPLFNQWTEIHDEKQRLVLKLQKNKDILAQRQQVDALFDDIKNQVAQKNYFIKSETEAMASAELQNIVKTVISEVGGQLNIIQVLQSRLEDDFVVVPVKVSMTGAVDVLRDVLYKLENYRPLLVVDELNIMPLRASINPLSRQLDKSKQLNITFNVICFMSVNSQ